MFYNCKLDAESLSYIANNINNLVEKGYDRNNAEDWKYNVLGETKTISKTSRGRIDIYLDESVAQYVINECGNILIDKGWTVYFNDTLYEYTNVGSPYDVSEANGYTPDASKWNKEIYIPNNLIITEITTNGEMINNE